MKSNTRQHLVLAGVLLVLALAGSSFEPAAIIFADTDTDFLHSFRGDRQISDDVLLIYIDTQEVTELGGWPLTRDYYGYLIYVLKQAGAKVIALDILFPTENNRYPEFDRDLGHFARITGNVCTPFEFAHLSDFISKDDITFAHGDDPQFPFEEFRGHLLGMGFSNLADETIARRGLLAAVWQDSIVPSFGIECARQYLLGDSSSIKIIKDKLVLENNSAKVAIPIDKHQQMRLNHFNNLNQVPSISLVDLFQTFQQNPDSLNISGKLVFVGVLAPGAAPMKVTPLHAAYPATLLQLTIAENIIGQKFVRMPGAFLMALITFAFGAAVIFIIGARRRKIGAFFGFIILYLISAIIVFKIFSFALPLLQPFIASMLAGAGVFVLASQSRTHLHSKLKKQFAGEMLLKAQQLEIARAELAKINEQLKGEQKRSMASENAAREEIENKEKEIQQLQNDLMDMSPDTQQPLQENQRAYSHIIRSVNSPLNDVLQLVQKVAPADIPVLISGETGTGKEIISRAIYSSCVRKDKPFIAVNCGALSETLLESELFGHEKGAFTGATARRLGRFELADKGTLFLDEITETSANFQAKLLRVLQEGTFERLGGEKTLAVDVRVIAASSNSISKQVDEGFFRQDLFYRLNGFPINVPPLRERREDIPLLAQHFLLHYNYAKSTFSKMAMEKMQQHRWPGNVRELENTVRRAAILAQSEGRELIREIDLPETIIDDAVETISYLEFDEQVLESLQALKFSHSSISQTARALGNKDRGTISDYLRGLCFEQLVLADFNTHLAAINIAGTEDENVVARVQAKMEGYLNSVKSSTREAVAKGLPKKYHDYLDKVIEVVHQQNSQQKS